MSSRISPAPEAAQDEAGKLIEQRTLLKGWLSRLEERSGDAPPHLIERVRADYLERLRQVGEQLGPHAAGIRSELEAAREKLAAADLAQSEAADALGEAQLRHLIGEIAAAVWTEQEPELQFALEFAQEESTRIRGECERLAELLAGIEGEEEPNPVPPADGEAADEAAPELSASESEAVETLAEGDGTGEAEAVEELNAASEAEERAEPLHDAGSGDPAAQDEGTVTATRGEEAPWLALIDSMSANTSDASEDEESEADERDFLQWVAGVDEEDAEDPEVELLAAEPGTLEEELGFLEELDRALATSSGTAAPRVQENGRRRAVESSARATLLCRECGSTNDVRAWYCEICGAELS